MGGKQDWAFISQIIHHHCHHHYQGHLRNIPHHHHCHHHHQCLPVGRIVTDRCAVAETGFLLAIITVIVIIVVTIIVIIMIVNVINDDSS